MRSLLLVLVLTAVLVATSATPAFAASCRNNPWMTEAHSSGTTGDSGGDYKVSMRPTDRARRTPSRSTNLIWNALWTCVPRPRLNTRQHNTLYKQLYCHVRYGIHPEFGGPTWDLESWRSDVPWWYVADPRHVLRHKCNWGAGAPRPSS